MAGLEPATPGFKAGALPLELHNVALPYSEPRIATDVTADTRGLPRTRTETVMGLSHVSLPLE